MALAFVDDSGNGGDSPYYVLAGYSATEPTWRSFWISWQSILDLPPKLSYFKMSEAESRKGQFVDFTSAERDARLSQFINVILSHDLFEASVAMPEEDYRELLDPVLDQNHASPYYFSFIAMVTALSGYYRHYAPKELVHFIFDEQEGMETRMLRLYGRFRGAYPHWNLGEVGYRKDHDTLPLQAADLIAWQTRRFLCSPEPTRNEFRRLHSGRQPYRKILKRRDVEDMAKAIRNNISNLRQQVGDSEIDALLAKIQRRERKARK